jgi:DNA-binding transcriptional ArsR family regulator
MHLAVTQNLSVILKAKLFRGLSDPSRLSIVEALRSGKKTVSEIVTATQLSQPNASAHLSCLKDCGLLTSRQEGRCVFYALSDPNMEVLIEAAERILSQVTERISCCTNYECQTAKKCMSDKQCTSSVRVSARAVNIPLAKGQV